MSTSPDHSGSTDDPQQNLAAMIDQVLAEQAKKAIAKDQFVNPHSKYSGEFTPGNLMLDANLQEFANRTSVICALESNGKISPRAAYDQIKSLWHELSSSKQALFGDD
ncbi:MAG: hypothetical protein SFT94_12590 [Pseudanabaenaceae cyanobacterium bins.68]|nr:hypothetical protein [Pseudanabaenaceae cyanobacterium bins.68]